jgi:TolA-binding protein
MLTLCRWAWLLIVLLIAGPRLMAAPSAEERAFKDAERSFHDRVWDRAETELAAFAQTYTNSPRLAEAILFQGEARFWQSNYTGAISLLSQNQNRAGPLADEYQFWIAEARLHRGEFQPAADAFAKLVQDFPYSSRRLRAVVEEASARSELEQWPQVISLLEQTNGVFESSARTNAAADLLADGFLLLAQAHLAANNAQAAESVLERLAKLPLDPATDWHRAYLLCRIKLAEDRPEEALSNVTNLFNLAAKSDQSRLKAETYSLEAGILQRLGRVSDAIVAYTNNLSLGVPAERRREAWFKIGELSLAQENVKEAAQTLQQYLSQFTNAPAEDVAWLTLGELRLRQAMAGRETNPPSATVTNAASLPNPLDQAVDALKTFIGKFPQSPLFGKAQLDLGWCFWAAGKIPESQAAFQVAIQRLPPSTDQVVAYFKLADTEFRQTNLTAAIAHYSAVADKFPNLPQAQTNFIEPALYQIVRAGLALNDLAVASNALTRVLTAYPDGFHTDRAVLLSGQAIGQADPTAARRLFSDFTKRSPNAPLRPEVELAIARTYEQQNEWPEAIQQYELWLNTFTNHPGQARAEYSRSWASFRAGMETNALTQFTNFIARFPTDEFAPRAQWWVADYAYRQGDVTAAEQGYKWCYQNTNWPATSELAYQARLMAGRCAVLRQNLRDAKNDYFLPLINDTNKCPSDIQAQAWFAFGDALMSLISPDSTNRLPDYGAAITAFDKINILFPSNPIVALAQGEKACCLLQLAQNTQDYARVTNAFRSVLDSPLADARTRSIAKVGLGVALEKLADKGVGAERTALLAEARDHYLDVFYGKILHERERPDPFWTREAGLKAARLLTDSLKQRQQAIAVYQRLQSMCPVLRLDEKINSLKAQEQEARQSN